MDIVMIRTVTRPPQLGQRHAQDNQALTRSQLNRQIDKEHPIRPARQWATQEKQADTQQPQANGFSTRPDGCHNTLEGGKDQGDAAIAAVSVASPGQGQTNQQQGIDMPFGAGQFFRGNHSLDMGLCVRSIRAIICLSMRPPKNNQLPRPSTAWPSWVPCNCCSSSLTRVFQCSRLLDRSRTVTRSCRISCCFSAERCFHRSRLARSFLILRAVFPSSFITVPRHENASLAEPDSGM